MSTLRTVSKLSITKFVYYNFFCKKVIRDKGCYLIPFRGTVINMQKGAKIELHENYSVCIDRMNGSKQQAFLLLRENATFVINGKVNHAYGSTIEVHKNAEVSMGKTFINSGAVIIAAKSISIGEEVLVSRNVMIYDADHHKIVDENGEETNLPKPTIIGDHVWIGIGSKVLRGSKIESGAVIAAGSVVMGRIKAGTTAMGYPARSISAVLWEV